jgi:class 3 adenylate cyclase
MIEALLSYHRDQGIFPIGAVKIGREGEGGCLWAEEVFSNKEYVKNSLKTEVADLFLALRGNDIDVVREVPIHPSRQIYIGFSISDVLRGLASLSGKPVLISASGIHKGFYPNGSIFDYEVEGYTWEKGASTYVQKGDKQYVPFVIDFSLFKVSLLTPKEEATAVVTFLQQLGQEMVVNVGLSLIAAAFISFFIALILLRNISVKITKPITMLSNAAEHLGDGRYADITLPNVEHRQDEVAKLTHSFAGMVGALQDRDKIRGVLHKVVSKEISEEILKRNIDFTGEEKVLTMLFSDIRNFTKMSEGFSPRALITMLNVYLTRMCRIIDATHGVVDKFVGDEIMTLYGAPLPLEGHAILAIQAALAMIQDLIAWNKQREAEGLPTFSIGIGIHTGLVYTGNMGAENRLNYTAIGANVNLASRVCSVAEPMQILVTEETMRAPGVLEKFHFRALEPKMLKGIEDPVILYEVSV